MHGHLARYKLQYVCHPGPGDLPITATYPGDNAYLGSTSSGATLTVNQVPTSMSISVNPVSTDYGSTATLTESGLPSAATGTVTFTSASTTLCTATLPAKTCSTSASLPAGTYTVTGTYSGNTIYAGSTSTNTDSLTVDQLPAFTTNSTTFTVGTAGSFQVAVTGYPAPVTSEANFTACTTSLPIGVTFSTTTGTLSGTPASGTAGAGPGTGGTYPLCLAATNSLGSTTEKFVLTITGMATSISASVNPATVNYGSTASLAESGLPSAATGTVTFNSGGTTLCTAALPAKSCSTSATLAPGNHNNVTATYSGDTSYAGSSSTNTASLTVNKIATSMSVSISPATISYGSTATLTESGLPSAATGTVTFRGRCHNSVHSHLAGHELLHVDHSGAGDLQKCDRHVLRGQ